MTELNIDFVLQLYEKTKENQQPTAQEQNELKSMITSILTPINFTQQFDAIVFGSDLNEKEAIIKEDSTCCNKVLTTDYCVCNCD